MESNSFRKRTSQNPPEPTFDLGAGVKIETSEPHPAGQVKHGAAVELLRLLLFLSWFLCCIVCTAFTQYIGAPLYFYNKDWYYAYMAFTKQSFGIVITTITQWFSPTTVRVSGDASMRGQLSQAADGRLVTAFPERIILIANHQLYTDWLYMWWIAYANRMHGHIYIILKETLKYIPMLGSGMMFYGFVFMSRKWTADKPRLQYRLSKLKARHGGPMSGAPGLDPMWLLIYPEGTNLSANTRKGSVKWAEKQGIPDLQHLLLPRSTGLLFCLQELKGTVDWIYDCTVAYEGTPQGGYAQDAFTLRSTYLQGRPPTSVNMYWRRFPVSSIPDDPKDFEQWVNDRWKEKDRLLKQYFETGRFPADLEAISSDAGEKVVGAGYINTAVRLETWYEIGQIFVVLATCALVADVGAKIWNMLVRPLRG